jgi:hypothetical protein
MPKRKVDGAVSEEAGLVDVVDGEAGLDEGVDEMLCVGGFVMVICEVMVTSSSSVGDEVEVNCASLEVSAEVVEVLRNVGEVICAMCLLSLYFHY